MRKVLWSGDEICCPHVSNIGPIYCLTKEVQEELTPEYSLVYDKFGFVGVSSSGLWTIAMARRRAKKKTPSAPQVVSAKGVKGKAGDDRIPRSMVIRMGAGDIGPSVSQLVKDMRMMMEPHTASRLKVGNANTTMVLCLTSNLTRSEGRTDYATTPLWQGHLESLTYCCSQDRSRVTLICGLL